MTFTFDCPWCGDLLDASVDAPVVRCATCAVSMDLTDPAPAPVAPGLSIAAAPSMALPVAAAA